MKLSDLYYEVEVNVPSQKAWEVLARYGDVGDFHPSLKSSRSLNGSPVTVAMGADRECTIPNGRKDIVVSEKVIDYKEGEKFTYDVYAWKNFPLRKMQNTFGVVVRAGKTIIFQRSAYRLKPGFLTGLMKGKVRSGMREVLIAYKHILETGEEKPDLKLLRKRYRTC